MVNDNIVKLIQDTADSFTQSNGANYKAIYSGYSCVVFNEYTYEFLRERFIDFPERGSFAKHHRANADQE